MWIWRYSENVVLKTVFLRVCVQQQVHCCCCCCCCCGGGGGGGCCYGCGCRHGGGCAHKYAVLKRNHKIYSVRKITNLSYALRCIIIVFGNHHPTTALAKNPDSSAIFSQPQIIWTNHTIWQKVTTAISACADLPCSGSRIPDETFVFNLFLRRIYSASFTCQPVIRAVY